MLANIISRNLCIELHRLTTESKNSAATHYGLITLHERGCRLMMMLMMVVVRGDVDVDDGDDTYIQLASITRSIIGS